MYHQEQVSHSTDELGQSLTTAASSRMRGYLNERLLPDRKLGLKDYRRWLSDITAGYVRRLGDRVDQILGDEDWSKEKGEWVEKALAALNLMAEKGDPCGIETLLDGEVRAAAKETLGSLEGIGGLVAAVGGLGEWDEEKMGRVWDQLPILVGFLDELDGKDLVALGVDADGLFRTRRDRLVPNEVGMGLLRDYDSLSKVLIPLGVLRYVASRIPTHVRRSFLDFE